MTDYDRLEVIQALRTLVKGNLMPFKQAQGMLSAYDEKSDSDRIFLIMSERERKDDPILLEDALEELMVGRGSDSATWNGPRHPMDTFHE